MSPRLIPWLVTAALAAPAVAQPVLRVGPGEPFSTIQAALAAAAPDSVILVARAAYSGALTIDRPVRLVAEPGTTVDRLRVTVEGLAPSDFVLLRGFTSTYPAYQPPVEALDIDGGTVHVEDCTYTGWTRVSGSVLSVQRSTIGGVDARGQSHVALVDSRTEGHAEIVLVYGCYYGCSSYYAYSSVPAVVVTESTVTIAGGEVQGGEGQLLDQPAIELYSGRVVVTGNTSTRIAAGGIYGPPTAAIRTHGGELVLDPDPVLVAPIGAPRISGPARVVRERIPYLRADVEGRELAVRLNTFAGANVALLVSPFSPPVSLPIASVSLWTLPPLVLAAGIVPGSTLWNVRTPLPSVAAGSVLRMQGLVLRGGALALSNPAVTALEPH
ncbi:MAG: hypothetical protein AAF628_25820 [Planctomycetota bacterium]